MLYVVATPIGNLSDMTMRAIETLKNVDLILCENTQHTKPLLTHYQIKKPLLSFHKFNEKQRKAQVMTALEKGQKIALVSDAGTPGINDPGSALIDDCYESGLPVEVVPGASSLSAALSLAGEKAFPFTFIGFLPKKGKKALLEKAMCRNEALFFFESPQRLNQTLELIDQIDSKREVVLFRELTKRYEQRTRALASALATRHYKGECIVMIDPGQSFVDYHKEVEKLIESGIEKKVAIQAVSVFYGVSRRKVQYADAR